MYEVEWYFLSGRGVGEGEEELFGQFEAREKFGPQYSRIKVGQGPIAFAVGAGGSCFDIFPLVYHFSFPSASLGDGPI